MGRSAVLPRPLGGWLGGACLRTIRGMTLTTSPVLRMASPPHEDTIPDEADAPLFNHHRVPVRQALVTECGYS
jgi:hypothetical protein